MRIVLAGNPNAGKSTLFNSLTGESRRVGNWHGVTVDEGEGSFNLGGKRVSLVDLPGLYTVRGSENEESVAEKFLVKGDYDIIVIVTEAKTLKRTARLVREIKAYGKPVILFVNLVKEFEKRGGKIFADKLSASLGVPVFAGEAIDKTDVETFKARLLSVESPRRGDGNEDYIVYPKTNADGIKYNPIFGCSCFLVAVFLTFYLAFGRYSPATYAGRFFTDYLGVKLTKMVITALSGRVSPFILGLITEGIIGGTFSVLEFLPQIAVLSFCRDTLDACGFLSYAQAFCDGVLSKVGSGGRAIYTLMSGYGCTALAAASSSSIGDDGIKKRTILCLPFVSCSARTPVYSFIAVKVFKGYAFLVLSVIYILSATLPLLYSFILYKTVIKRKPRPIAAEIANFRRPNLSSSLKSLLKTLTSFIIKLGSVVLLVSVAFYVLRSVSPDMRYVGADRADESLLAYAGKALSFLLYPLGIKDWRFPAALIGGIFAKESVASTLFLLFPAGINLTTAQGVGLVAFTYLYTPCVTALFAMKKAIGIKKTALSAALQLLYAVAISHLIYLLFGLFV